MKFLTQLYVKNACMTHIVYVNIFMFRYLKLRFLIIKSSMCLCKFGGIREYMKTKIKINRFQVQ